MLDWKAVNSAAALQLIIVSVKTLVFYHKSQMEQRYCDQPPQFSSECKHFSRMHWSKYYVKILLRY